MDKIFIEDLEFIGYHGVWGRKKLGQKFLISLELETRLREAGIEDNLEKTTHGFVAKTVEKIFFRKIRWFDRMFGWRYSKRSFIKI